MKMTNLIAAAMAVSVVLVVLGGILNSASIVAISGVVVGTQDGRWFGVVALLLGLAVIAVFVYAYRQSIWNWWIRGSLIALSAVIFLVSAIGMADNFMTATSEGGYQWTQGRDTAYEEVIRVVPGSVLVLDFDFVVLMILVGSIGVAAVALWGAFRWESAKVEEIQQEGIRGLLDELPPEVFQTGANYREELERYYGAPSRSGPGQPEDGQSHGQLGTAASTGTASPRSSGNRKRCPQCWTDQYENARFCHACGAGS